jgi:hypothetical protein
VTFAGATLLANDTGIVADGPERRLGELRRGTIAGTDPHTFTPAPGFAGGDLFPYEIRDAAAKPRSASSGFLFRPTWWRPASPFLSRSAATSKRDREGLGLDNAGVASVTFFDGTFEIG